MAMSAEAMVMLAVGIMLIEGVPLVILTYLVLTGKAAKAKVREVFWIHKNGILLGRRGRASMEGFDLDIFASMLTAVVDFIKDGSDLVTGIL